jgi:hypothetical protein
MTDSLRARCRHAIVIVLLLASVAAIGATTLAPTALERCVDDGAATWNGTASELWSECAEMVGP